MSGRISVFDIISNDAYVLIDKLGYEFLSANGYSVTKAKKYRDAREKLARRLRRAKEELILRHEISGSERAVSFWYVLKRGGKVVAVSERLVLKEKEDME